MFHHNFIKIYSELKRFARINPLQTSSLSLSKDFFPISKTQHKHLDRQLDAILNIDLKIVYDPS